MTQIITDDAFEAEVKNGKVPVLVDFYADWCGPCRQLSPVLEEISAEMEGKIKVVKMDIDKSPNTPNKYGVRGIPTMILFKDGQVAATKVGSAPKSKLVEWISSVL